MRPAFDLSIVIPTRNEEANILPLVEQLAQALAGERIEIIFVDDSDDGTPQAVRDARAATGKDIVLIHRPPGQRRGGLAGAVVEGLPYARSAWVCVMDGDLQHPAEVVPRMLARARDADVDVVVGTRDTERGVGLNFLRRQISRGPTGMARVMFPRRLRDVADPLSGFFLIRRPHADELDTLHPRGFKILFELITRFPQLRTAEVSYTFQQRLTGDSSASAGQAIEFLRSAVEVRLGGAAERLAKFGVVGLSGIAVNLALTAAITEVLGVHYLVSAVLATQGSTVWNFVFLERWVFLDRTQPGARRLPRFLAYALTNNAANALRVPLLWFLADALGIHYLVATLGTLLALFVLRYALSARLIWPYQGTERQLRNA